MNGHKTNHLFFNEIPGKSMIKQENVNIISIKLHRNKAKKGLFCFCSHGLVGPLETVV